MNRQAGYYEKFGTILHYIPSPLPPENPSFQMSTEIAAQYGAALQSLAMLNEFASQLPKTIRLDKAFNIKEALLSSEIEGIYTTFKDLHAQPFINSSTKSTQLVLNYGQALEAALVLIEKQGLPIANRVILEAHKELMTLGNQSAGDPGQFRKQSVRVGPLVPAPASLVPDLMAQLEQFINTDDSIAPLIKAGLVHVQFETIHPFLDGNGRIGRLLIVLMLIKDGLLHTPVLYPSYYFKKYQLSYYHHLDKVRTHGDFESWILFYLAAIEESSQDAYFRAKEIEMLYQEQCHTITSDVVFARKRDNSLRALMILFESPVISIGYLARILNKNYNTAHGIIKTFVEKGWLKEQTEQQRNKLYTFVPYLAILEKESYIK